MSKKTKKATKSKSKTTKAPAKKTGLAGLGHVVSFGGKRGNVVAIIKANVKPDAEKLAKTFGASFRCEGGPRPVESYVCLVEQGKGKKPVLFWPQVSQITKEHGRPANIQHFITAAKVAERKAANKAAPKAKAKAPVKAKAKTASKPNAVKAPVEPKAETMTDPINDDSTIEDTATTTAAPEASAPLAN
jgi:hypothetical protein